MDGGLHGTYPRRMTHDVRIVVVDIEFFQTVMSFLSMLLILAMLFFDADLLIPIRSHGVADLFISSHRDFAPHVTVVNVVSSNELLEMTATLTHPPTLFFDKRIAFS